MLADLICGKAREFLCKNLERCLLWILPFQILLIVGNFHIVRELEIAGNGRDLANECLYQRRFSNAVEPCYDNLLSGSDMEIHLRQKRIGIADFQVLYYQSPLRGYRKRCELKRRLGDCFGKLHFIDAIQHFLSAFRTARGGSSRSVFGNVFFEFLDLHLLGFELADHPFAL